MSEDREDAVLVEGQQGTAAARVPLPCLSAAELSVLQQQLQQHLQQLFFDPSAECKAAANRWLLQFQRSPEAWQVARHVLEKNVLVRLQQQQQQQQHDQGQQGGLADLLDDQLLLLAAQTLAWKVVQQPEHLSLQEKKQLAIFLMQLAASLQQQQQQIGPQLLGPLLSRLSQCIAHCAVHCSADASVWGDAVADIVAFACNSIAAAAAAFASAYPAQPAAATAAAASASVARAAAVRSASTTPQATSAHSTAAALLTAFPSSPVSVAVCAAGAFFTLPCCLALWSLAAIPDAIKSLDAPTRGCRRATETPQALRCERHTKAVLDLAADVLLARTAVENAVGAAAAARGGGALVGPGSRERIGGGTVTAASGEATDTPQAGTNDCIPGGSGGSAATAAAVGASGGGDGSSCSTSSSETAAAALYQQQQHDPQQRVRQRWCVEEGVLPLLVNWMGLWEQPFLQHELLCEALAAAISPLAAEPALTDCLVTALPRLSSYMQLWNFTAAALPAPARNGSTNAVLDGVGRSTSNTTTVGGATAGGGGGSATTAAGAASGGVFGLTSSSGGVYTSSTDAQQQLLLAWADPGLPTVGGEGRLCNSVLQQLLRFSAGLARKERTQETLLLKFKQRSLELQQQRQQLLQTQDVQQAQQQQALITEERRQLSALQQQLNDGAELALLLRWGAVVRTLIEGFPPILMLEEPTTAAARFAACGLSCLSPTAAGGGSTNATAGGGGAAAGNTAATMKSVEGQAVCGELLLQLWRQQPQTWLCASNVWSVVKELRRDQLLPPQVLQLLLQRLAPTCVSNLLQHCRRDSPWWRWGASTHYQRAGAARGGGGGVGGTSHNSSSSSDHNSSSSIGESHRRRRSEGAVLGPQTEGEEDEEEEEENVEEWNLFVESAGDTACDLFFLYDACGGEESHAFLQSLGQSMQMALQQGDAAGAEVLLLLTDALVEGLNCIPVPLAPLFLCLPALPRTSAPCAAAAAKLLKKAAIHFTEEDPEYDGLLTAAPHALETATPCGAAMLRRLWVVALQTLLQLLPLHPQLGADSILQLATWGGHHLGAASGSGGASDPFTAGGGWGGGTSLQPPPAGGGPGCWTSSSRFLLCGQDIAGGGAGSSQTLQGKGDRVAQDACASTSAADGGSGGEGLTAATDGAGGGGSEASALQQLEMFCSFVEQTGPYYSVQVDATLHAAAIKLVLTSPRKEMPSLFNRSMQGARQLLQHCLALDDTAVTPSSSTAVAGDDSAAAAVAAAERRRCVSRALQRLESCCSALCGGKVYVSRTSSSAAAGSQQGAGGGVSGAAAVEEEEGREAAAALQFFLGEGNLWMTLLQVMRATLLKNNATAFPVNIATKQRVHFGLLTDLKSKEPLQQPQDNDAVLVVLTIRCLRLLLRGLGSEAAIAPPLWAAVAELVADVVTNALHLVDSAAGAAAGAAAAAAASGGGEAGTLLAAGGVGGPVTGVAGGGISDASAVAAAQRRRSSSLGVQAALQACSVVLLGDLLRIAAAGKSSRDVALLQAAKAWAARGLEKITLLFVRLGVLLNARHNHYDVFSPYFDFLLAYAAAATPCMHINGSGAGCSSRKPYGATTCSSSSSSVLVDSRYASMDSSHSVDSSSSTDLQQDDLFAQAGFEATLRVAVQALQRQDADTARQCVMYCHACSNCRAERVDRIVESALPQILRAILDNLHCWGLENLSVLWKAFALWSERYHAVFLSTIYEWLAASATPPPLLAAGVNMGGYSSAYGRNLQGPAGSSSAGASSPGSVLTAASTEPGCNKALEAEQLVSAAPGAVSMWGGCSEPRSIASPYSAAGREGNEGTREVETSAGGGNSGSIRASGVGGSEENHDGSGRLLRGMDAAQKEVVFCCFRNFRGARMRQLLQDLCLIASGAMLPSDALVAYEYALQTEQKIAAKDGGVVGGGWGTPPAASHGGALADMED